MRVRGRCKVSVWERMMKKIMGGWMNCLQVVLSKKRVINRDLKCSLSNLLSMRVML